MKLNNEQLAELNAAVTAAFGLKFDEKRLSELERRLAGAVLDLGLADGEPLYRQLRSGACTPELLAALGRRLTTGETHFFRDPPLMHALQCAILPELIAEKRASGILSLKIWCAACSTGEELYTLAIILRGLLPDIATWRIELTGTDLNDVAIAIARKGEYREWSFRGTSKSFREEWFEPAGDGSYRVKPALKNMARFAALNLMDQDYSKAIGATGPLDLIVCRNVFIYFPVEVIQRIAKRFAPMLRESGWLCVAPTEATQQNFPGFVLQMAGEAIFFRPEAVVSHSSVPAPKPPARKATRPPAIAGIRNEAKKRIEVKTPAALEAPAQAAGGNKERVRRVRELADAGRRAEAMELCAELISENPLDVRSHRLHAMLLADSGEIARAAESLRTLLFLDPRDPVAHFMMGHALRRLDKPENARRSFAAALRLACEHPPETALDDNDDLTAGMLCEYLQEELR